MKYQSNIELAPYTSLRCGGLAEYFTICNGTEELKSALTTARGNQLWVLGYGTNSLISDHGLPGCTILVHGGDIDVQDTIVTADAGVWWDDLVETVIQRDLWGLELMSGIPSSVGAAITGNIAAYGQQVSDQLQSVSVLDTRTGEAEEILATDIDFSYRNSSFQSLPHLIVTQATFQLSSTQTTPLQYAGAKTIANERGLDEDDLIDRQAIILEARRRAGSLYDPSDPHRSHTAGSFFKNPDVSIEQATELASFDESGKTLERILQQNKVHGGTSTRASAAHALLAAGFKRGQHWGDVRLHPEHILKLENTGAATAQEIYDVAQEIMDVVEEKLGIRLEPEVKFLGEFTD